MKAPEQYLATAVAFPGTQGTGEVKLHSSDPNEHPVIDPKFLSHAFDRRVAIESVRETLEFLDQPVLAKDQLRLAAGPTGLSDDEILVCSIVLKLKSSDSRFFGCLGRHSLTGG